MHEIGTEENVLNRELAFSKSLLGKECAACHRAYLYNYFDKDSSSRDGRAHICPSCKRTPRLSTAEHVERLRELNDDSEAVEAQRRKDEIDYLQRNSVGRALQHNEFLLKLKELLGTKLIVGDAYFLNEFSLYIEDRSQTDTHGVRYIGYIPVGRIQEFSSYTYDKHGVAIDESKRGYRGILLKLIMEGYITEERCEKAFGSCNEAIWCKRLFAWRNNKI